jgi:uncharacterized iron-regulated membrane protein
MKRLLFEVHRWVGIALALFMTLWFFSGLLIIYAEPTTPTRAEQLAHAELLIPQAGWLSAGEAWERSAADRKRLSAPSSAEGAGKASPVSDARAVVEARLVRQAGEPVWLIEDHTGQRWALSAIEGAVRQISADQALSIAKNWVSLSPEMSGIRYLDMLDKPALLRNQEGLRPFHRIAVEDGENTELLISARTGEVVSAATGVERALYWAGNWVHLFRPLDVLGWGESRVTVLTWAVFFVVVAALTGLIVGWLRWRPGWFGKKTYSEGRVHPYREFWFRWHFWGGLVGGVLALTWGLSGYLNNNPWQIFSPANPSKAELKRYVGGDNLALLKTWSVLPSSDGEVVAYVWRRLGNEFVALVYHRDGLTFQSATQPKFSERALQAAAQRLAGDSPLSARTLLQEYDSYYYLRYHRDVADRPLPVWRVELGDAAGTYLYLNPQDGRLLLKQDRSRRVYRWLYSALHHWDFGGLYQRPLWDAWMLTWVLLGLVLSVSAVVIGWKRLVLTARPKKRAAQTAVKQDAGLSIQTEPI